MDGAMADRMDGYGEPAFLGLGYWVMLFDARTQRAFAEPASCRQVAAQPFFSAFFFFIASWKRSAQPGFTS